MDKDYESAHKRVKINSLSSNDMSLLRYQGKKHIDLWSDGRLYPIVPTTKSVPPFLNCSSLLKYVGDGAKGLLGYTLNLASDRDIVKLENHLLQKKGNQWTKL